MGSPPACLRRPTPLASREQTHSITSFRNEPDRAQSDCLELMWPVRIRLLRCVSQHYAPILARSTRGNQSQPPHSGEFSGKVVRKMQENHRRPLGRFFLGAPVDLRLPNAPLRLVGLEPNFLGPLPAALDRPAAPD